MAVADRVTVLRGGRTSRPSPPRTSTPRSLAALMVGREIDVARRARARRRRRRRRPRASRASDRRRRPRRSTRCEDVSFAVRAGEIVGIAGVAGNGQRELAEAVSGMRDLAARHRPCRRHARSGRRPARGDPPPASRTCRRTGSRTGLAPSLSIASNVVLKTYRERARLARAAPAAPARSATARVDADQPLRRAGAGPGDAGAATCPAATCRRSCSAASSRASPRARRGRADPRPRRRRDRDGARATSARRRPTASRCC